MRWIQKKSQSSGVMTISQRLWKTWYANRWVKSSMTKFSNDQTKNCQNVRPNEDRKEMHVQPCQRIWSLPVKQPETNFVAILLVTFLGWLNDPLKGDSWPPNRESKGHGLNHLVWLSFNHLGFRWNSYSWTIQALDFFSANLETKCFNSIHLIKSKPHHQQKQNPDFILNKTIKVITLALFWKLYDVCQCQA